MAGPSVNDEMSVAMLKPFGHNNVNGNIKKALRDHMAIAKSVKHSTNVLILTKFV